MSCAINAEEVAIRTMAMAMTAPTKKLAGELVTLAKNRTHHLTGVEYCRIFQSAVKLVSGWVKYDGSRINDIASLTLAGRFGTLGKTAARS